MNKLSVNIIILGDAYVGKTALLYRFTKGSYNGEEMSTIGLDFASKNFISGSRTYKAKIWDTAGAEQYRSLARAFYKKGDAVILAFDLSNKDCFYQVNIWC